MTHVLAQIAAWLSAGSNALGRFLLAPIGVLPGWLSATVVAAVTGVLLLAVFKYTSNQRAIERVRNDINANLLALKLFKDSARVSLRSQGRILQGAFWLFVFAIVPMLVMVVPVTLLLGQLALWYQARPLRVGEDTVITLKLNGDSASVVACREPPAHGRSRGHRGPGPRASKREVCWNVKAREPGSHRLVFQVGDQPELEGTRDRRRLDAGQHRTAGLGLVGHPAEPRGGTIPTRPPGPVDRDRLPSSLFVDQRHRLVGHLLVRRLHGRRPVLSPRDERRRLRPRC